MCIESDVFNVYHASFNRSTVEYARQFVELRNEFSVFEWKEFIDALPGEWWDKQRMIYYHWTLFVAHTVTALQCIGDYQWQCMYYD